MSDTIRTYIHEAHDETHLLSILSGDIAGKAPPSRLWTWLGRVGPMLPSQLEGGLVSLVRVAIGLTEGGWVADYAKIWREVLEARRSNFPQWSPRELDTQAVQISLTRPDLPFSSVLLSSFPSVYKATVASSSPSFLEMIFMSTDWDKAKELRRKLIEAYIRSSWPRADLVRTAWRSGILDKIVSRARRHKRDFILREALEDLARSNSGEDLSLANQVRGLQERHVRALGLKRRPPGIAPDPVWDGMNVG